MTTFPYALVALLTITTPVLAARASTPLLTFVVTVPAPATLASNDVASAQYQVTNNSAKTQIWTMVSIAGVIQITSGPGDCASPFTLATHQSCLLDLQLIGSEMGNGVDGGPVVCVQNNPTQCYQPTAANVLDVTIIDTIFANGFEPGP